MTQTASAPAPAPRAPASSQQRTQARPQASAQRTRSARTPLPTPTLLRLVAVLAVVVAAVSGLVGWQAGRSQAGALDQVSTSADRLLAAQDVRNQVVAADAVVTNGFLVGGLEPASSREAYAAHIDAAAQGLGRLHFPSQKDTDRVATATASLATYVALVEQARTANRQGLPVGIGYLDQASAELRLRLLPELDALVASGADQAAADFNQVANAPWLLLLAFFGLGVLVAVHVWDSRRTHRMVNLGLAGACLAVLVVLTTGIAMAQVDASAQDVRTSSYRPTLALSQAVSQAYDAQSLESLTLIKHGSGAAYEAAFVTAAEEAQRQLARVAQLSDSGNWDNLEDRFNTWLTRHGDIRAKDDSGDWDGAVELALDDDATSARAAFDTFIATATGNTQNYRTDTTYGLKSARQKANNASWVALAAGLVAAPLAWWGLAQRREEYR